jgi:hypothetical protein
MTSMARFFAAWRIHALGSSGTAKRQACIALISAS